MDYPVLLPQTKFEMRANLATKEPARFKKWDDERAYQKMCQNRKDANVSFNIHDGPPYANGHIHIGHALNKILKDIITKTHYFFGEKVAYVPGWDCHGLPIEQQVETKLGDAKKTLPKSAIREHCRAWANEFIEIQKNEFKALGVLGDFENPYKTLKTKFEANIFRTLCEVAKKGLLVERSKPVFWSWAARSALAEAEIEYEDKEDYSIFVAFDLQQDACEKLGVKSASAVIWTTTPWTLPANQAISLNPNETYVITSENLVFAEPLLESLTKGGLTSGEVVKRFSAKELEGLKATNPLNGRDSLLILGEHVLMDGGTGLVHTAPGHGEDDYFVSLRYGIPVLMPVDEGGLYDESIRALVPNSVADEFVGLHIFKANEKILELLGSALLKSSKFTHSYPFCWRTHKPVIYRATKQWFVAMDEPVLGGKSLREVALDAIKEVKFYPESGRNRLSAMVENRPDWCISRQRDWGVPIAFFRQKSDKSVVFDAEVLEFVASVFDEKGADAWWDLEVAELLPEAWKARAGELEKCEGILDVWFDSGSTWNAVLKSGDYEAGELPASMYLEGSDQHRGWFQSSLLLSCAVRGKAPFKSVLTHGFTVDKNGNKMSKSKGNVVAPADVAAKFGVEVLRLWVASSDYSGEQKIGDEILKQIGEQYRKIRNTVRFLLASVEDLDAVCDASEFKALDAWILKRASEVFAEVSAAFKAYEFSRGYQILLNFLSGDLSGIYLDVCKDRLYCNEKNGLKRRSAQSAMALILRSLLPLLAPVLTHTVDEALEAAPVMVKGEAKDVFDLVYVPLVFGGENLASFDEVLVGARGKFNEAVDVLKKEKTIKNTLELFVKTDFVSGLSEDDLADWFVVSGALDACDLAGGADVCGGSVGFVRAGDMCDSAGGADGEVLVRFEVAGAKFVVVRSPLFKCPRCWKFSAKSADSLCERCEGVMKSF